MCDSVCLFYLLTLLGREGAATCLDSVAFVTYLLTARCDLLFLYLVSTYIFVLYRGINNTPPFQNLREGCSLARCTVLAPPGEAVSAGRCGAASS